jgi:hypothetical protein
MNNLLGPGQPAEVAVDDNAVEAVIYKNEQIAEEPSEQLHRNFTLHGKEKALGRRTIKRGPGKRRLDGKDFHLAGEIDYIRTRAAEHDGRLVSVGPLVLFSTETGDAWLLDPADHLATRLARDGDPEDVYFEETDTTFAIGWKGNYKIDGQAFIYIDSDTARVVTILGYPTLRLAQLG